MGEYSLLCQPPWKDAEIEHKLNDAEKSKLVDGYLLDAEQHHRSARPTAPSAAAPAPAPPQNDIVGADGLIRPLRAADTPATNGHVQAHQVPISTQLANGHVNGINPADLIRPPVASDRPPPPPGPGVNPDDLDNNGQLIFQNFYVVERQGPNGMIPEELGYASQPMVDRLLRITNGWPRRVGEQLFAERKDHRPLWIKRPSSLMAWISSHLPGGRRNQLRWTRGKDKVSESQFFDFVSHSAESFAALELYPHWPPLPHHYYMHPPLEGGDGAAFSDLLSRFNPATPADAHLILRFLPDAVLGWLGWPTSCLAVHC